MTDFFDRPGRPQHPDFWELSSAVLRNDGRVTEGGEGVEAVMSEWVDPESVTCVLTAVARCT